MDTSGSLVTEEVEAADDMDSELLQKIDEAEEEEEEDEDDDEEEVAVSEPADRSWQVAGEGPSLKLLWAAAAICCCRWSRWLSTDWWR